MSDKWDWLRDELRASAAATEDPSHNVSDDDVRYLLADRDALAERCEKLRDALRPYVIIRYTMGGGACRRCHKEWSKRDSERHAPGCLAAPKDATVKEKNDHGHE